MAKLQRVTVTFTSHLLEVYVHIQLCILTLRTLFTNTEIENSFNREEFKNHTITATYSSMSSPAINILLYHRPYSEMSNTYLDMVTTLHAILQTPNCNQTLVLTGHYTPQITD
jgi:hypothetical protein